MENTNTTDREDITKIDKINPTPKVRCPECGGKIMVMVGAAVCERCSWSKDLYNTELQKGINSLINLYLDGVKYSIFPPIQREKEGTASQQVEDKRIGPCC